MSKIFELEDYKKENLGCNKCNNSTALILQEVDIINYFHPIISSANNTIAGFESLCRGVCKNCNRIILPDDLFKMIKTDNEMYNLDLKSRQNSLEIFNKILEKNKDYFLFLNFEPDLIEKQIENPETLVALCKKNSVRPENIVIEITESKNCDINILKKFVDNCRKYNFLIALDDLGTGFSNFDRISMIKPDIIKIDRSIISNLDKDYYKKVIFKSLSRFSSKIGALILAEGTETENETVYSLELGSDLVQGFYFALPGDNISDLMLASENKIVSIGNAYKKYKIDKIKSIKKNFHTHNEAINTLSTQLSQKNPDEFDNLLETYIDKFDFLESLYILDYSGIQVTHTHLNCNLCDIKPRIFKTVQKGDSHYYKDYFYLLQDDLFNKYTTDAYLSLITGYLCRTISVKFTCSEGTDYILCMNVREDK